MANNMKATDKQVNYLTILTNKVNKLGMTTLDASLKISAFKSLIRGINMKRSLFNLPQF